MIGPVWEPPVVGGPVPPTNLEGKTILLFQNLVDRAHFVTSEGAQYLICGDRDLSYMRMAQAISHVSGMKGWVGDILGRPLREVTSTSWTSHTVRDQVVTQISTTLVFSTLQGSLSIEFLSKAAFGTPTQTRIFNYTGRDFAPSDPDWMVAGDFVLDQGLTTVEYRSKGPSPGDWGVELVPDIKEQYRAYFKLTKDRVETRTPAVE